MRRVVVVAVLVGLFGCAGDAQARTPMQAYNQLWARADVFYGADGQPPPWVVFGRPSAVGPCWVENGDGFRRVVLDPDIRKRLNLSPKGNARYRHVQNSGRSSVLHEWAHVYQRADLLTDQDPLIPHDQRPLEARADAFANAALARLSGALVPLDIEQFGSNYGMNPRLIPWVD